ncbi:MAG: hypothetical protein IJO92_05040 [Clostridia bacterium]|nr:hypothetical protein [Clostridia bacterium]MBQ9953672.1 hypothetical protein [Clostridia bacterium]
MNAFLRTLRWIAKHWALTTVLFLIVAITATTLICWNVFGKEKVEKIPVFVTVSGLGEGKDMVKREYTVDDAEIVSEMFSVKYPEIYRDFESPLVANNTFRSLLGVSPSGSKRFYVTMGSTVDSQSTTTDANNLTQSYVYSGCELIITYR